MSICKSKSFLILSIIVMACLNLISPKLLKNRFMLLVGPTRAGKSCFINTITDKQLAKVGDESGDSTTKNNELFEAKIDGFHENQPFLIGDTMGLDDSEESALADPMILANVTLFIKDITEANKIDLDAILLFESLTNDSNNLQKTIKKLKAVFSETITKKIIVVLNKNSNPHPKRIDRLVNILKKENLNYIHWKNGCDINNVSDIYYDQMRILHDLILKLQPFNQNEINNIVDKLKEEGKNIFRTKTDQSFKKLKFLYSLGSAGLMALSVLNLPAVIISNLAVWSMEEFMTYFNDNVNFLLSLAIEERIKKQFEKKGDL